MKCEDFLNQASPQAFFEAYDGSANDSAYKLNIDSYGISCNSSQ